MTAPNGTSSAHAYDNAANSLAHTNGYDGLTYDNGENDMLRLKQWMHANGMQGANLLALPHGSWSINTPGTANADTQVMSLLRKYFDAARTTYPNTFGVLPACGRMEAPVLYGNIP